MTWYIVSVSLHIFAACVWIGGMVFLAAAVLPVLRRPPYRPAAVPLLHAIAAQFRWTAWSMLALLVATGIANLRARGFGLAQVRDGTLWQGDFGRVLAVKLAIVALLVAVSAWHDLVAGPRFTRTALADPDSTRTRRLRRTTGWFGRVILLLSLAALVLGVMLVRGVPR
jgi:putative copper resistance protein D